MRKTGIILAILFLIILAVSHTPALEVSVKTWTSTRVKDTRQHERKWSGNYPFRNRSDYVLRELDLQSGDVALDIGAGDGWWTEKMAPFVGEKGLVYAAEIEDKKVDSLKKKFKNLPQVKPHLCKTDNMELPENSCDLVFLSQTFHHLDKQTRVEYLHHLRKVVKPTGRLCVIERYPEISTQGKSHGTQLSVLATEAEKSGWICVRFELMPNTYHFLAILVQRDLFPPEPERKRR